MRWIQASVAVLVGVMIVACSGVQGPSPPANEQKKDVAGDKPAGNDRKPVGNDKGSLPTDEKERLVAGKILDRKGQVKVDKTLPGNPVVEVNLNFTNTSDADLKGLELTKLPQLRKLILTQNPALNGTSLADLSGLQHLQSLDVAGSKITDDGMKALATLKPLTFLYASNIEWGDAGVKALAGLERLEDLTLSGNANTTDAGYAEAVGGLKQLRRVDLNNCSAGDLTAKALSGLPNLRVVSMYGTRISDKGVADLAKLTQLEELRVGYSVKDEGAKAIANLKNLKKLSLWNTDVTDQGLRELHGLKNLREADVSTWRATPNGVEELRKALPECNVIWQKKR